eukprot:scaffold43640_cov48-Attheya_sp.AAC.2
MSNDITPEKTGENPNNNDLESSSLNREEEAMTGDTGDLDLSDPAEPGNQPKSSLLILYNTMPFPKPRNNRLTYA